MSYQRGYEKKLNVAMIGIGSHCYRNLLPALHYLPVKLKSLCDPNADLLQKTANEYRDTALYTNAAEMYQKEKLDAVFISVSPALHPQLAIEALDAGVHVWMEKPPARRATEIDRIIEHRKDRVVVVGFKKAFMPAVDKVLEIVSREPFKQLKSILAVYPMSIPADGEKILAENTFTNWLGNGCHPISCMIALCGSPRAVTTIVSRAGVGSCMIEFENGAMGTLCLADGAPLSQPQERYDIFTGGGTIGITNNNRVSLQRGIPFDYNNISSFVPVGFDHGAQVWEAQNTLGTLENVALFTQGIVPEMKYFCDCILESKPAVRGSLEFAREVMAVYEAGLLSQGRRIELKNI